MGPISGDPELGHVYLPVEDPTGDYYGGDRHGDNLFSSGIVALDVQTGERQWHYQFIHHDIWDWDVPNAPIIADLPNGRKIVMSVTKQAWIYAFDRLTGEPIWPSSNGLSLRVMCPEVVFAHSAFSHTAGSIRSPGLH